MDETFSGFTREGLSISEACAVAGIGRTKIYQAISNGNLKARKCGKRTLVLRDDLRGLPRITSGCRVMLLQTKKPQGGGQDRSEVIAKTPLAKDA